MIQQYDTKYLENFKKTHVLTCEKCGGRNYKCDCWKAYKLEFSKIKARIPIRYRNNDVSNVTHPQVQKSKKKILEYISDIDNNRKLGTSLYLFGDKGVSKTLCATSILTEGLKKDYKVIYIESLTACMRFLFDEWNDEECEFNLSEILTTYDFVAIDEIGTFPGSTEKVEAALERLFRERSGNLLPTLFVSNFAKKDISGLEEKILNLFEESLDSEIEFRGVNYRKSVITKAKEQKELKNDGPRKEITGEDTKG